MKAARKSLAKLESLRDAWAREKVVEAQPAGQPRVPRHLQQTSAGIQDNKAETYLQVESLCRNAIHLLRDGCLISLKKTCALKAQYR